MRVLLALAFAPLLFLQTPPATPGTPPPVHDRCIAVDPLLVETIESGLKPDTGATLHNVWAVRSDDFELVWFVAGDLEGPALDADDDIAIFATNMLDEDGNYDGGAGFIFAVGGFATEFSDWPDGGNTDAEMSIFDDGAELSEDCARGED